MSLVWYPVEPIFVVLTPTGGAGPSDIVATDSATVTDAITATTLAAVPTESATVTESPIVLAIVTGVDSAAVTDSPVGALVSSNQVATDAATATDAVTQVLAIVSVTETATATEALTLGTLPVVASESATVSEVVTSLPVQVFAVDSAAVSESIATSTTTGANITTSETITISESIVATLVAAAIESATVSDTPAPVAIISQLDIFTVTEDGSIIAPFVGMASALYVSLGPRMVGGRFSAAAPTWDSTLITFDSTLTTFDGGYVGELGDDQGLDLRPRMPGETVVEERMAGTVSAV